MVPAHNSTATTSQGFVRPSLHSVRLIIALGVYILLYWIWLLFVPQGTADTIFFNNLAYLPPGICAAILAWQAGTGDHSARYRKTAWRLISIALIADALGNFLWLVFENILGLQPFPSWADALYLASYPLMLAGVLMLAGSLRRYRSIAFWLDATIIMLGGGMVVWYLVLGPTVGLEWPSPLVGVLSLAYPVGSLLHLFAIATVAVSARGVLQRPVTTLLLWGLGSFFVADVIYGAVSLSESYGSGHWVDGVYLISYGFMAWAAKMSVSLPPEQTPVEALQRRSNPVPYLSAAAGYGLLIMVAVADWGHPLAELAVGAALLATLGAVRVFLIRRENLRLHAERAERAAAIRFQALVQHATDIILILNPDGSVSYASPAATRILGYEPEQMPPIRDLVAAEQQRYAEAKFAELLQSPDAVLSCEARLQHRDGSWRTCVITWRNLLHEPHVGGIVAVCHDITARAEAEAALRASETSLRAIIDTAPVGISRVGGEDGRFDLVNQALCTLLGYTPAELGQETVRSLTHPDDYARELAEIERLLKREIASYTIEKRYLNKHGAPVWTSVTGSLIYDEQGRPTQGLGIVLDIRARRAAEEQLRRTQTLLQSFIDHAPLMIALYDAADGRYMLMNQLHADSMGLPVESLSGRNYADLLPAATAARWRDEDAQIRASGNPLQFEENLGGVEGRTLLITKFPVFDEQQNLAVIGMIAKDITDRKQSEEALRESHAFLQATLDALSANIAILDPEGTVLTVNAAWRQFGAENGGGDSIGTNYLRICAVADDETSATAEATAAGILAVRDGKLPSFTLEYPCPSPEEARWFMLRVTRFGWKQTVRLVVAHENITARKIAEQALQISENRLRTLVQHIPGAAVLLFDHDLRYLVADGRGLEEMGFLRGQLEGRRLAEVLPEVYVEQLEPLYRRTLAGNPPPDHDMEVQDRTYHTRFVPIRNSADEVIAGMILALDITKMRRDEAERFALEQRLQETQRLESIGTLAGGVAHDFNNLLQAILGHVELLELDLPNDPSLQSSLVAIRSGAEYAAALTEQLLAYAGKGRFILRPVVINKMIRETVELTRRTLNQYVQIRLHLTERLSAIEADEGQIRQIILNLLLNASEALPSDGGVITIETTDTYLSEPLVRSLTLGEDLAAGRYVQLKIRDTGAGMDADTQARIFEPFFSTKFAGRGLGLAAVHGIIRSHRGAIQVISTPGVGTSISIWLPALATEPRMESSTPPRYHPGLSAL